MKHHILLTVTYIVFLLSSCAYQGEYYANDKISTRYGMWGGVNRSQTQKNRDGRGDSRFREPMWYSANGFNSEPRAKRSDSFEQANLTSDLTRMRTGSPRSGRFDLKRTKSIEKYEDRAVNSPSYLGKVRKGKSGRLSLERIKATGNYEEMLNGKKRSKRRKKIDSTAVLSDALAILELQRQLETDSDTYKDNRHYLLSVEYDMKNDYRENIATNLRLLQGIYKDFHEKGRVFSSHCTDELLGVLRTLKKEFRKASPTPYLPEAFKWRSVDSKCATYFMTDGQKHVENDYVFTYLFGDPEKVDDKGIAQIMFGDSIRKHPFESRTLENFVTKSRNRDRLKNYFFYNAENKWYMVTMGDYKVYLQIKKIGDVPKITSIINPARDLCAITK